MQKLTSENAKSRKRSVESVKKMPRTPITLLLENIRSAYNVGAIFRTADATLIEKIILIGTTPRPPSTHIDKSALGATDVVPWEYFSDMASCIADLRKKNYAIVALEQTDDSHQYNVQPLTFPLALIVGNEVTGVNDATLTLVDYALEIPMRGRATSLNVATATGIVLYDMIHRIHD